jgi:hypothetical protein
VKNRKNNDGKIETYHEKMKFQEFEEDSGEMARSVMTSYGGYNWGIE